MPFGNKARAVRAYEFGCLPPCSGRQVALDAMYQRVRLWNRLVQLDRGYEGQREALIAACCTVSKPPNEERDKAILKDYYDARRAAFKMPKLVEQLRALDKQEGTEARAISRESGLNWMNYDDVLLSWQQARKRIGQLQFHSARDEPGKLTVRWQNGLPLAKAFLDDTRMQLDPVPPEAYVKPIRHAQKRLLRDKYVRFRVASAEDRSPIWVELPVFVHRPLPENSLIRQASLLHEQVGTHWRWKLVIVVENLGEPVPLTERTAHLHISLGWSRQEDGSIRVATWQDDAGQVGAVLLPKRWVEVMGHCEGLQSIRDQRFNAARADLAEWMRANEAPAWLKTATLKLGLWKSPKRLGGVVWRWVRERFEGDSDIFETMNGWRRKERHLYDYQANQRDEALKERRYLYRQFAAEVARQYGEVKVRELSLDKLARRRKRDDGYNQEANHQRFLAAPSTLRLALKNACEREGVRFSQKEGDLEQKGDLRTDVAVSEE